MRQDYARAIFPHGGLSYLGLGTTSASCQEAEKNINWLENYLGRY